jgi:hypothetical protein
MKYLIIISNWDTDSTLAADIDRCRQGAFGKCVRVTTLRIKCIDQLCGAAASVWCVWCVCVVCVWCVCGMCVCVWWG